MFFVFGEVHGLILSDGVTFFLGLKGVVVDRVRGEVYGLVLSNGVTFSLGLKGVVIDRIRREVWSRTEIVLFGGGERRTERY